MKALVLTLTFGSFCSLSAQAETYDLRFHGGAVRSYVDDRLTLRDNGSADLKTLSPFPYRLDQNAIGVFSTKLDQAESKKLRDEVIKLFRIRGSKPLHNANTVLGEVSVVEAREKKGFVWPLESDPAAKNLESLYYGLKTKLFAHPKAALRLHCKRSAKTLICSLTNIGSENVRTVDPLGVTESVFCLGQDGKRGVMNPGEEIDPRNMSPKHIQLKKAEKFDFSIDDNGFCRSQILLKTSDLLINSKYKNALLGELISNELTK